MNHILYAIGTSLQSLARMLIKRELDVWHEGNEAYYAGKAEDSCPYSGTFTREEWLEGYHGRRK